MSSAPAEPAGKTHAEKKSNIAGRVLVGVLSILVLLFAAAALSAVRAQNQAEQLRRQVGMAGGRCETEPRVPAWLAAIAGKECHTFLDSVAIVGVSMEGEKIGDENVARLAGLKDVVQLNLELSHVTTAGLKSIAQLKSLRLLNLMSTQITDVTPLVELPNLHTLRIDFNPQIEFKTLGELARLPQLRILGTKGCRLRDDGVAELAKCTQLESLDIGGCALGESGLVPLHALKNLQALGLELAEFSDADLAAFQKAVPGCRIVR